MARPKQQPEAAVEEVKPVDQVHSEEEIQQAKDQAQQEDIQAFNEHVKSLVNLFVEAKIQGLEQRIKDLETVVAQPPEYVPPPVLASQPEVPSSDGHIPQYVPEHQQGGVGWYQPPRG